MSLQQYLKNTNNCLLVREEIGKAKRTCYDLPKEGHCYGVNHEADFEGAREVTTNWATHTPSVAKKEAAINYIKFNKSAASKFSDISRSNLPSNTAREMDVTNTGRDLNKTSGSRFVGHTLPSDIDPNFAFGKKTRPSTPIGNVIGNGFGVA